LEELLVSKAEKALIREFAKRYLNFLSFLTAVMHKPFPPTETEQTIYTNYRNWFRDKEGIILPRLQIYLAGQEISMEKTLRVEFSNVSTDYKYAYTIFNYFYESEDLTSLAVHLNLQYEQSGWKPSQSGLKWMSTILQMAAQLVFSFYDWARLEP